MSALESMGRSREQRDAAEATSAEAAAAARAGQRRLSDLQTRLADLRQAAIAQRVAANDSGTVAAIKASDIHEVELDLEAAEINCRSLTAAHEKAQQAFNDAHGAWQKAVCRFAQEREASALADVETALETLGDACARAIAAAKVSLDFGEIRGSHNLPTTAWYGSGGRLVAHLREMAWPTWPNVINPGRFKVQFVDEPLAKFPGVLEAETAILSLITPQEAS
jgi:hypothetical protein